jgi:hypothetical protein
MRRHRNFIFVRQHLERLFGQSRAAIRRKALAVGKTQRDSGAILWKFQACAAPHHQASGAKLVHFEPRIQP